MAAVRRRRSARTIREGQRTVVRGDRRGRPAGRGAAGRRRAAGAGPQLHDLRADLGGDAAAGGQLLQLTRRDRRRVRPRRQRGRHRRVVGDRPRDPGGESSRRQRLRAGRSSRAARRAAADQADFRHRDGGARLDLPAGGRHRHHEHHAGERDGAHARDRRAARDRRDQDRHHPSVRSRDDRHRGGGRRDRPGARRRDVAPDRGLRRVVDDRHHRLGAAGLLRLGGRGAGLRCVSSDESGGAGSGAGAALRCRPCTTNERCIRPRSSQGRPAARCRRAPRCR